MKKNILGLFFILALVFVAIPAKAYTLDDLAKQIISLSEQVASLKSQLIGQALPPSCYLKVTSVPMPNYYNTTGWDYSDTGYIAVPAGASNYKFNSKNLTAVGCDITISRIVLIYSSSYRGNYWEQNSQKGLFPNGYTKNETTGKVLSSNASLWELGSIITPFTIYKGTTNVISIYSDITKNIPHFFLMFPDINVVAKNSTQENIYVDETEFLKPNHVNPFVNGDPRIAYWPGKVNQHFSVSGDSIGDSGDVWYTDPDGKSGATIDKLTYCKKFYPNTIAVEDYMMETINTWCSGDGFGLRGSGCRTSGAPFTSTRMTTKCVQDLTPRIMYWPSKVNQHFDQGLDKWMTDPDGKSGSTSYWNDANKLTYCKKWYPNTLSVANYKAEALIFKGAGNLGSYPSTRTSVKCVQ